MISWGWMERTMGDQLLGFPFVALHIAVGEVEPHQIQLTIIGKS
ncbi:MAG: hypothetical protein ACLS61_00010 [Ruminococcus sp.]